jgi:hypothetical protein
MRNHLERAALVACAALALASARAQTPPAEPSGIRVPPATAPGGDIPPPRSPDAAQPNRPAALGARAPANAPAASSTSARPQAPTDTTPPTTTQAPPSRSRAPVDRARPAASAPSNVGRGVDPLRTPPSRATDPSNPIDPAAADPSRPADPTRAREKAPKADAGPAGQVPMHVAAVLAPLPANVVDDPLPRALAACMREVERGARARCAHDIYDTSARRVR